MAFRPAKHGFSAEASTKIASKYPQEWEADAKAWVESVYGGKVGWGTSDDARPGDNFAKPLVDGIILCNAVNNLFPGSIKKIHDQNPNPFKMQENISNFVAACGKNGVDKMHVFQTIDLFEKQNIGQVITCLQAVSRQANKANPSNPLFGPKQSDECRREFTEEQLKEAARKAH